jgi:hypothetical protein
MKKTFLIILLFSITKTFACSCIGTNGTLSQKVEKAFIQSDLILTGTVIEMKIINKGKLKSSADPVIYKFEIIKNIKGKLKKEIIEIVSEISEVSCGYRFEIGGSYLVYARKSTHFSSKTNNEFDFVTSICERNRILHKVNQKEIQKLEKLNCKNEK